jgi:hypothetical protein
MPTLAEVEEDIDDSYQSGTQNRAATIRALLKRIAQAVRGWLDDEVLNLADQEGGFAKITDGHIDMQFVFDGTITNGRVVYINNGQPTGTTIEFSGSTTNFPGPIQVSGTQVVNGRRTGWTPATGTPVRTAFNADDSTTVGGAYNPVEVQQINDKLVEIRQRFKALQDDLISHGLIGT